MTIEERRVLVLRFPTKHVVISQRRLENLLRARRMVHSAELDILDELENGAEVEAGERDAWIREVRKDGCVKRTLSVK